MIGRKRKQIRVESPEQLAEVIALGVYGLWRASDPVGLRLANLRRDVVLKTFRQCALTPEGRGRLALILGGMSSAYSSGSRRSVSEADSIIMLLEAVSKMQEIPRPEGDARPPEVARVLPNGAVSGKTRFPNVQKKPFCEIRNIRCIEMTIRTTPTVDAMALTSPAPLSGSPAGVMAWRL